MGSVAVSVMVLGMALALVSGMTLAVAATMATIAGLAAEYVVDVAAGLGMDSAALSAMAQGTVFVLKNDLSGGCGHSRVGQDIG